MSILAIYDNSDTGICEFSETAELARIHGEDFHITSCDIGMRHYIVLYTGRGPSKLEVLEQLHI